MPRAPLPTARPFHQSIRPMGRGIGRPSHPPRGSVAARLGVPQSLGFSRRTTSRPTITLMGSHGVDLTPHLCTHFGSIHSGPNILYMSPFRRGFQAFLGIRSAPPRSLCRVCHAADLTPRLHKHMVSELKVVHQNFSREGSFDPADGLPTLQRKLAFNGSLPPSPFRRPNVPHWSFRSFFSPGQAILSKTPSLRGGRGGSRTPSTPPPSRTHSPPTLSPSLLSILLWLPPLLPIRDFFKAEFNPPSFG